MKKRAEIEEKGHSGHQGRRVHIWCEVCTFEKWADTPTEGREIMSRHDHDRNDGRGVVGCSVDGWD